MSKEFKLNIDELDILISYIDMFYIKVDKVQVLFLNGDIGSGKTTLVKNIANYLKINSEVTSPTFSFLNNYEDKIFHYDLYNIELEKFINIGLFEGLANRGLHIIEWGNEQLKKMLKDLNVYILNIDIDYLDDKRLYKVSG